VREVQRDAAGSLRVSLNYSILPPRMGDRGLNESHQCPSQTTRSVANTNDKALDCARLFIDTSIGMMIGQTH
jgi:hypothetical protein